MKPTNRKPSLEDRMEAVLARDSGMPYSDVIKEFEITPMRFELAVREISDFIHLTGGNKKQTFESINSDPKRKKELFNMGYEYIKEQYDRICRRIPGEKQSRFYSGTLFHEENIENIIYYALISNHPKLSSSIRDEVIEEIKNLPSNPQTYLKKLKLSSLVDQKSILEILEIFDKIYQRKTEDKSLFNLEEKTHLHKWGDNFIRAQKNFWKNQDNVIIAIYHILTENNQNIASNSRSKVIKEIKNLPSNLQDYFWEIGLQSIMVRGFKKGKVHSPLGVLELFDIGYQKKTKNKSLFDLEEKEHLHKWNEKFKIYKDFWCNPNNVYAVIYHTLIENNPNLASNLRSEVIKEIKNLPSSLQKYFVEIGLGGVIQDSNRKKKDYTLLILKVFDEIYQNKTGDKSLFDKTQENYLEIGKKNRLVRNK